MSTHPGPSRLRFDRFVFDRASGELSAGQESTRLQPQVAALLELLLERPGHVVTRAELRDRLWPDTTVEFDQGLNFCVRQLRLALGDDASQPRFIETLPKRGYRFLADVAPLDLAPGAGQTAPTAPATESAPDRSSPRRAPARTRRLALVAAVAAAAASGAAIVARRESSRTAPPMTLAVMPFDLEVPDSAVRVYRNRLAEALVERTTRVGELRVNVLGPTSTGRFDGTRTPLDTLASALGATHVLSGVVRRGSDGVQVFAQLIRVSDGRHLWAMRYLDSLATDVPDTSLAARITTAVLGAGPPTS